MIVDISGYSYSGKGAVMDLLRDFPQLHVHQKEFEFLLIRATDGLLDLRTSFIDNYSEIRIDMAIRRFLLLIHNLSSEPTSLKNPLSLISPPGQSYSKIFPNFENHSEIFMQNISFSSEEYWPFPSLYKSSLGSFFEKIKNLLRTPNIRFKFNSYITPKAFDIYMNEFLQNVLFSKIPNDKQIVVTSNMLEVYSPKNFFDVIQPCKLVIVDRDPRGIFCSLPFKDKEMALNDEKVANEFIKKFKFQRSNRFTENLNHENILNLKFEDLFIDFDDSLKKLGLFLETTLPEKFSNFSKERSFKNFQPWQTNKNAVAVKMIERELKEFLLPRS
jgi:hypothetical protein